MAFPNSPLDTMVEMYVDGAWTDISSDVRVTSPIAITRGRQDQASQAGPSKATLTLNNRQGTYSPLNTASPYFKKIGRNTPLRVTINEGGITAAIRYVGEVIEWPQRWDVTGNDVWVPLEVAGIMRRLARNTTRGSAPHRLINSNATAPGYYWPLNDPSGDTAAMPFVGDESLQSTTLTYPSFGGQVAAWLDTGVSLPLAVIEAARVTVPGFVDEVHFDLFAKVGTDGEFNFEWSDFNGRWEVTVDGTAGTLSLTDNPFTGTVNSVTVGILTNEQPHHIRVSLAQSGGTINITGYVDGISRLSTTRTGTLGVPATDVSLRADTNKTVLSTFVIWTESPPSVTDMNDAFQGWAGEDAATRISRLCTENDITLDLVGTASDSTLVGPQGSDSLLNLLNESANADGGVLYETRDDLGLSYRTRVSRYNQTAAESLDYDSRHLSPPLEPVQDDDKIVNAATVTRKYGHSAHYEDTTSPLSVNQPPDGVGRYDASFTLSLYSDTQAYEQAGWKVHLGTVDELRYPRIRINLAANPGLAEDVSALDVGDRLTIANPPAWLPQEPIDLQIEGYTETINNFSWDIVFNCVPNKPWELGLLDDDAVGKLDTAGSELRSTINSSATSFDVVTTERPLWTVDDTEYPFDVNIGNEQCTVSDIAPATITFVNFGTEAHADNASVSPGIPASMQAGDLIIGFAAIRNTAGTVNLPTGYSWLDNGFTHARLFWKIHSGSESAPSVTFAGGSSGDTTSAELTGFRGKFVNIGNLVSRKDRTSTATSATATVPSIHVTTDNSVVLYAAWAQDDWATITQPSGTTKIDDFASSTGNDQFCSWSYVIQTTAADRAAGTFSFSVGSNAITKGFVVAFNSDAQAFTVTRSVNGYAASHSAGTSVSLWTPIALGL